MNTRRKLPRRLKDFGRGTRGASAIITAIMLMVLMAMASIAIDMGQLYSVRNDLQNTADAAALAAVAHLVKAEGETAVRDAATAQAKALEVANRQSQLQGLPAEASRTDMTVIIGEWNMYTGDPQTAWTPMGTSCGPSSSANAVRVTLKRAAGTTYGPVTSILAGIFGSGFGANEVGATATAYLGFTGSTSTGTVVIPFTIPENTLNAATLKQDRSSWWAKLFMPSPANATGPKNLTFKDLGSDSFFQNNLSNPVYDITKAYLVIVDKNDPVPSTIVNNIKKNYGSGTAVRPMKQGDRLYPISEYQWASNIKTIFQAFKSAYDDEKGANGKWRVLVPVYSTTAPTAHRLLNAGWQVAHLFNLGPSEVQACFYFHTQTYPGGNVPIYVDGFANVDITNVSYVMNCDTCLSYSPAADGIYYTSSLDCMVRNNLSCRNQNSVTVEVPVDADTVSPPGSQTGGPPNDKITPGGSPGKGAIAAIPKLVR